MKSSKKSRLREAFARMDAEDQAVRYLAKLPAHVALKTALNVEQSLGTRWEKEQTEMIRRGDPREVCAIIPADMQRLEEALERMPADVQRDPAAEQHVIDLLAVFPPDRGWTLARAVATWARFHAGWSTA
jgi:hypothetical protein